MASIEMTPEQEEMLKKLEEDYPCEKRQGWALKGCSCEGGREIDTNRVKCKHLGGNVNKKNCYDCPHQKAYLRLLASRKKG